MINKRRYFRIPLARRLTRRWLVVACWILLLALAGLVTLALRDRPGLLEVTLFYVFFFFWVLVARMLGGEGRGGMIRNFHGRTAEERRPVDYSYMTLEDISALKKAERESQLDEREVNRRNAAHYKAYEVLRWLALTPLPALPLIFKARFAYLSQFLLLVLFLMIMGLPQSILLWTEPDMEAEEPAK